MEDSVEVDVGITVGVGVAVGAGVGVAVGGRLLPPPQLTSNTIAVERRSNRMALSFIGPYYPMCLLSNIFQLKQPPN